MDDLISRQAAIDVLRGYFDGMLETDTWSPCDVYGLIEVLPSAQPERKKGKWIETDKHDIYYQPGYKCSVCGVLTTCHGDYCPNCGADMREKNTPSAPQWIPMSEREPEFGNYLITYREKATGRVDVAMDLYWSGGWDDDGDKFETIAYMPLPEPYKGDE